MLEPRAVRPGRPAAVLCDMDGTLIDSEPIWFETEAALLSGLGFELGPEHARYVLGQPNEVACKYLLEVSGLPLTWQELSGRIEAAMVRILSEGVELLPGAKELLVELAAAGVPAALVSASPRSIVDACLGGIGADYFRHTVSGDEVVRSKPDPEPYLRAARLLGVPPGECVVIEDSPTGTASGVAAGCRVLSVPHAATVIPHHPRVTEAATLEGVDLEFLSALPG